MKNKFLVLAILISICASVSLIAQTSRGRAATQPAPSLLDQLPASDAVATVKVKRVLDEVLPKLLAENPAKVAEVNEELARFKAQTGLDPRAFDQIALGLKYTYPSEGITKIRTVVLARGSYNAEALVAAGRLAANGKYSERNYQGKTIYVFNLERQIKLLGMWNVNVRELAVSALDRNTLAIGDVQAVHSAIDAGNARVKPNAELIALANRDPNAILGFGGNISEALLANLRLSNDSFARELTAVRKVYGTLGMTASDLELMLAARTVDQYAARNLSNTVEGLKQLGGLFVGRLSAAKGDLARAALDNLKITTQGNELQIKTAVAQSQVAPLMRGN